MNDRYKLLLVCAAISSPALAQTEAVPQVTDQQVVCQIEPSTPSCANPGAAAAGGGDVSISVRDEKAFRLVPVASSAARTAATPQRAATPSYVAPAASSARTRGTPTYASTRGAPVRATQTQRFAVVPSSDMVVTFRSGSAQLTDQAANNVRVYARVMKSTFAAKSFVIEGHTDAVGKSPANLTLSQRRAQSVVDMLVSEGVQASHLTAKGYGSERLRYPSRPRDGANRRVELIKTN